MMAAAGDSIKSAQQCFRVCAGTGAFAGVCAVVVPELLGRAYIACTNVFALGLL